MTENTASGGSTSATSVPAAHHGSEIDEQTHRKSPVPMSAPMKVSAPAKVDPPPPPPGSTTGSSPVKEGAVKAAAAALAAARSAAKKVQSAIPDGSSRAAGTTDQPAPAAKAKPTTGTKRPQASAEPRPQMHYSAGGVGGTTAPLGTAEVSAAAAREAGPRRVRLSVSRVDPWSVMKLAFLLSVAIGLITVVATMVVWYVLNDMGTFATIQDFLQQTIGNGTLNIVQFIAFDRIVSVAVLIAIVDIVLLTAIATIMAILYNVTAALVGGVHLTLTDE
ncbi:DUF3566 domain-containing protein [Isoptericola sp. NEAU-Y5]|uniref:DUF3566 domain-containing protein n=1 Tax=Isoptericola luteus TaxID=2879484 RepID=A0ABS7ZGG5_9MICO|nr:DUF3566 domain-containing protein [Isoptericola sp. NEAU-Y5]MCA5894123.1 DUF3566 domain-containing protein [Isoptericola sp. NEAU-Y5]